ncbi:MAG TPA: hypothetical protein DCY89_00915 [Gammaproteobacteria bacterium]|nr:hypothetical protein [Gammaproteobacteria bacterium]
MTGLGELRVVVVDDDPVMLRLLGSMVRGLGVAEVSVHTEAAAALTDPVLQDGRPSCVLLDINMPGMDGIEFVRHLAERVYGGMLVLVSGEDEAMRRATAMLAQARGLKLGGTLSKPPTRAAILGALAAGLPDGARTAPAAGPSGPYHSFGYAELQAALAEGQLVNHYQPQVSPQTGALVGVESLVRWQHPVHGLLPPAQFVAVAERYGLIGELLVQTLRQALGDLAAWQGRGHPLRVAVNVSMDNLSVISTADFIETEARQAGVDPRQVVLEVTESRLMRDLPTALDVLARLHLKRFRLSVDDFGTGHSTLVVLRDLLFDELKIDAGFVHRAAQDPRLATFFRASQGLAHNLGMEAVAEGVEDAEDWVFARDEGCDLAQGWFVARPMPADRLEDWQAAWRQRTVRERLLATGATRTPAGAA